VSFQQRIRSIPQVNPNYWSFAITGKVRHPLILSFSDLQQFPTETIHSALTCKPTKAEHPLIIEADWRGVPLSILLDQISIDSAAQYALIHAADRYTTILPLAALAQTLLAYERNGAPLTLEDGFPARLIAPGLHAYKMPKWIDRIELIESPEGGFWESYGWSLDGEAEVKAAIISHEITNGALQLSGVAYAGRRAITSVQISIDGSDWMPVPFTPAADFALTHWQIQWMPPGTGDYAVRVRASDATSHAEHTRIIKVR
jgi:DMSO/TMAO reductase YedYZ molybdopterin-dependent catalytic subunit